MNGIENESIAEQVNVPKLTLLSIIPTNKAHGGSHHFSLVVKRMSHQSNSNHNQYYFSFHSPSVPKEGYSF